MDKFTQGVVDLKIIHNEPTSQHLGPTMQWFFFLPNNAMINVSIFFFSTHKSLGEGEAIPTPKAKTYSRYFVSRFIEEFTDLKTEFEAQPTLRPLPTEPNLLPNVF